uniref:Integrase catalytic domain-containing protein n=1 Tax=Chromera velia CCMP2878 TaxID=1169474 RepID=A0A0G4HMC0_9ALVE|eukprot:Cvel_29215.t1-p1 / transcript=Cvel_29215.t1 / gene=Cvel_29215 / organism=Chromera_velia_CCMP2878 / gene_product=hypothetical protein / transcript_product=hypothetical protein / location=Cvel_scaffold3958:1898-3122(-) / protein_length=321 / sequence_SO=supercontig / SO=protein_coding / is_pseudo=false
MEVVQTDNGKEFSGDKKGQYDHFCQEERIFHRRGADYTPQHQGQGERANRTVKRLLRKVRRQTGLPPYTEKWLFQGVVQELNNCVSTVTGMDHKLFDSSLSSPGESKGEEGQGGNMNDSFSSYSSSPSLSGVSPGLGGKRRGSDEVDDGAFSDVNVEEVPCDAGDRPPAKFSSSFASARFFPSVSHTAARLCERYVATSVSSDIGGAQPFSFPLQSPAGIQIQTGQLEMHAQQEEGEERGREEREEAERDSEEGGREEREEAERDSEPRRGARRLPKREEREDGGGVPPSPIAEDVEVDWGVDSDGNALRAQEGREEVQAA